MSRHDSAARAIFQDLEDEDQKRGLYLILSEEVTKLCHQLDDHEEVKTNLISVKENNLGLLSIQPYLRIAAHDGKTDPGLISYTDAYSRLEDAVFEARRTVAKRKQTDATRKLLVNLDKVLQGPSNEALTLQVNRVLEALRDQTDANLRPSYPDNSERGRLITALSRHVTDNADVPTIKNDATDIIKQYTNDYKLLWETSRQGPVSAKAVIAAVPKLTVTTKELRKEVRLLQLEAYKAEKRNPEEIRFEALVRDMQKMISPNYNKVEFKTIGFSPKFFDSTFKHLARRKSSRAHQVEFLQALVTHTIAKQKTITIGPDSEKAYLALSQILAAGLMTVQDDIQKNEKNTFTSKLEKIAEHTLEKHNLATDTQGFEALKVLTAEEGSSIKVAAEKAGYGESIFSSAVSLS